MKDARLLLVILISQTVRSYDFLVNLTWVIYSGLERKVYIDSVLLLSRDYSKLRC